jgi:flagellar protein FliO/FliZ
VLELVLRISFSLLVVLALMWGVARLVRRPLARRGNTTVALLARQQLGRGSSVAVLRVLDRALVLGVTEQNVTLLGEADPAQFAQPALPDRRVPLPVDQLNGLIRADRRFWPRTLDYLRDRTGRQP